MSSKSTECLQDEQSQDGQSQDGQSQDGQSQDEQSQDEQSQDEQSQDETDKMPENISISVLDLFLYYMAILGHLVDLGLDLNVAVRYFLANMMIEFACTLAFILLPAFVNTAVSVRMYSLDKQQGFITNQFTRRKWLRIFMLVLQLAPILRFTDALIYAIKSRRAKRKNDPASRRSQRLYFALMLKEDSDAALLRIFECFLEAAPQQVLQTSLLLRANQQLAIHQVLSILSSIVGMGWCLAAYQRVIRYTQQNKSNMTWYGTSLLTMWHFFISLSRIISISAIACLYPHWTVLACLLHIGTTTLLLQIFEKPSFCSHNKIADIAFSFALGAVYLFTYILPVEGPTRYRFTIYYSLCFIENIICAAIWYNYADEVIWVSKFFLPVFYLCILPYVLGLSVMIVYYIYFHPEITKIEINVSFVSSSQVVKLAKCEFNDVNADR